MTGFALLPVTPIEVQGHVSLYAGLPAIARCNDVVALSY